MSKYYSIHESSKIIGVSAQTLRNWDANGKLHPHHTTVSGYRYYSDEQLNQVINVKPTSEIVSRKPRFICIEDLNVSGMMKNRHLSKAVQNQGFFEFRKQLEHKCSDKGIQLIVADRFYPSSKLCSCCGNIKKDLKLSNRVYRCECGNMIDRDFQASINLKTYGEQFAS